MEDVINERKAGKRENQTFTGHEKVVWMDKAEKNPRCLIVFLIYVLALILTSLVVVGLGLSHGIVYLFIVPGILSPFYFRRRLYLSMFFLLSIDLIWVASRVSSDFQTTLTNIAIVVLSSIAIAETIRRLTISREQAEEALKESEEYFRALIEHSGDVVSILDEKGNISYESPSHKRVLGYDAGELIGRNVFELVHPDDQERISLQFAGLLHKPGGIEQVHFRFLHQDGTWRYIEGSGRNLLELPAVNGIVVNYRDATEQVRAAQALRESEAQKQAILDGISANIAFVNEKLEILWVNKTAAESTNKTPEEMIGSKCHKFWTDSNKPCENCPTTKAFQTKKPEQTIMFTPGGRVWDERGEPVFDSGGELLGVVEIAQDITARVRAEEAVRANEEKYRTLFENLPIPVFTKNHEGEYTSCNAENRRYWTTNPIGRTDAQLLDTETASAFREADLQVMETGDTMTREEYFVDTPLGERQFLSRKVPLRDGRGNIVGILGASLDITERKQAEEERLKLKKLESVGVLAGGIAHDFNNLLTGVFGNIEMAKMFLSADHKSYKFLEGAWRSMESATRLTKQLLTFAKGGDPIKETLSIGEVITETARFSIRGRNVKLQTNIAPDLWPVEADKGQLSQVISNLVINAQQAMPAGGTITIAAENAETSEGKYVQITVHDAGIGISPQYLNYIFDPYFTTKQEGNGLGLATTYSIISKHGGTITVASQLDQGTTFAVRLPASEKKEEKTTGKPLDEADSAPVVAARILVLDDEEVIRDILGAMLGSMGHKVSFAVEGQEAIAEYQAAYEKGAGYDIVITDLTIPGGKGGEDVAREILEINPQAKIIVSSGYATNPVMVNYEAYGFQAMVVKPFQFEYLEKVMQQILRM